MPLVVLPITNLRALFIYKFAGTGGWIGDSSKSGGSWETYCHAHVNIVHHVGCLEEALRVTARMHSASSPSICPSRFSIIQYFC